MEQFSRTISLVGQSAFDRVHQARVAVFGVGGVGGYVCEALVRSGIAEIDLFDRDDVSISNLNRRLSPCIRPSGKIRWTRWQRA